MYNLIDLVGKKIIVEYNNNTIEGYVFDVNAYNRVIWIKNEIDTWDIKVNIDTKITVLKEIDYKLIREFNNAVQKEKAVQIQLKESLLVSTTREQNKNSILLENETIYNIEVKKEVENRKKGYRKAYANITELNIITTKRNKKKALEKAKEIITKRYTKYNVNDLYFKVFYF